MCASLPPEALAYRIGKGVAMGMRRQGVSDGAVKGMPDHKASSGVTDVYTTYRPTDMRGAVAALEMLCSASSLSGRASSWSVWKRCATKLLISGGRDRDRTCDPFHVKEVLYR